MEDVLYRNLTTMFSIQLGLLGLVIWLLFFSGFRWAVRLGTLAVAAVAPLALVDGYSFNGDMRLFPHFRWQESAAARLEEHLVNLQHHDREIQLTAASPTDYLEYRGPKRDGVIKGPALATDWKAQAPNGAGFSPWAAATRASWSRVHSP